MDRRILHSSASNYASWPRVGLYTGKGSTYQLILPGPRPLSEMSAHIASDACEWENLLSIFHPDAYIYTTWTGRTHHRDFIAASQKGMDHGAFIMHRCHGISTDINVEATRAVTKMKATITQRFNLDGIEADAESDCRFCFFWMKMDNGEWKARFVRHWYEKVCSKMCVLKHLLLTSAGQANSSGSQSSAPD
jgi:hypothetical protein